MKGRFRGSRKDQRILGVILVSAVDLTRRERGAVELLA